MQKQNNEVKRLWRKNAFWSTKDKNRIEAILIIIDNEGKKISQQLSVKQFQENGQVNPDFQEIIDQVGMETLDFNTAKRLAEEEKRKQAKRDEIEAKKVVDELSKLFDAKVKALEIEEIKNSDNKKLKSKLRRSKNIIEMQTIAQLIIMEQMGIKFIIEEEKQENND